MKFTLRYFLIGLILIVFPIHFYCQTKKIDSLNLAIINASHDTTKASLLLKLTSQFYAVNPDTIVPMCLKAIAIADRNIKSSNENEKKSYLRTKGNSLLSIGAFYFNQGDVVRARDYWTKSLKINEQIKNRQGVSRGLLNIGLIYHSEGNIPMALDYFESSLRIKEELNDSDGIAGLVNNIGTIYHSLGDIPKALEYWSRSLKIWEDMGNSSGLSTALGNMGVIYETQGDIPKALEYWNRGLKVSEKANDKKGVANMLVNIGGIYDNSTKSAKAMDYYSKALSIWEEIGDIVGIAKTLNNIGLIYHSQGETLKALNYFERSLKIQEEIDYKDGMTYSLNNIGLVYLTQKKYDRAFFYCEKALKISQELGYPEDIRDTEAMLLKIDSARGNYAGAFLHYKKYIAFRDSINNESTRNASIGSQLRYQYGKKAAADSVRVLDEKKVISAELNEERTKGYALYGGLALVLVFAGFMANRFRITNAQKKIIELKEHETQKQNEIILHQKHLVEEKHKEITDSINYAERIQRSFLATTELLDDNLKSYFVFFQPKDVVSGDFYWASRMNNKRFYLATADSTGHGVPGAIMSLLNITSIESAIKQGFTEPADILNSTRQTIIERLKKDGSVEGGKDGMDCSLVSFDFVNSTLTYSAANNPIWIVRDGQIIEFAPDKMPVGKHDKDSIPFTQHIVSLLKNDVVYTLTDGMPDQFGGPKGKKFMYKRLKELLISNAKLSMSEQKEILKGALNNWKGNLEQVDDICIIGVRISH